MLLPLQDSVIVLYFVTLCPFLFSDHLDGEERELAALLSFSSLCLVIVVWLLLSVPWVCLQFVIVILTYFFRVSLMRTACTFAWSSLSLVTVQNSHVVTQMAIECHFVRAAKDLARLHICTGLP